MSCNCDQKHLAEAAVSRIDAGVVVLDRTATICYWNRFMEVHSRRSAAMVVGQNLFALFPEVPPAWLCRRIEGVFQLGSIASTTWDQRPYLFRFPNIRTVTGTDEYMLQNCTFTPIATPSGEITHVCLTVFDATDLAVYQRRLSNQTAELRAQKEELQHLLSQLKEAQVQLLQSEKMAAIGQLAAGVAHEINNPISYVSSNVGTLDHYIEHLLELITLFDRNLAVLPPETVAEINAVKEHIDFSFLRDDVVELVRESLEGIGRVKKIVQDLKDFSHVDSDSWQLVDLHEGINSTLNIVRNEIKYKAEVLRQYGELPQVECLPSQLNQVFLNILINASQAIAERGTITVGTSAAGGEVRVSISDNGQGIQPEHLGRIFDPFFTTKPVGKGTGLGLALSYGIIKKHHGTIEVQSEYGRGTTFTIRLPVRQPANADKSA